MKHFIVLLLVINSLYVNAQSDAVTYYFNKYGERTEKNNADVYTILEVYWDKLWHTKEFDSKHNIRSSGQYNNIGLTDKQDTFTFYFPNGRIESKGKYNNDKKCGVWFNWFEDGTLNYKCTYKTDSTSKCVYYHYNGEVSAVVEYENDTNILSARIWDSTGVVSKNNYLYISPTLNGYDDGWKKFFSKNMYYPVDEEGKRFDAEIEFWILIDRFGKAHWGDVEGFAHPFLAHAVQRVVEKMPYWTPAIEQNRPVDKVIRLRFYFDPKN